MDEPLSADRRPSKRNWVTVILIIGPLVGLGLGTVTSWKARQPARETPSTNRPAPVTHSRPSDPRVTFATPYRNVRPEVQYVGDETCASCHPTEATNFRQHPMGRSAVLVSAVEEAQAPRTGGKIAHSLSWEMPAESYDKAANNPFEALGLEFSAEPRRQGVVHKEIRRDAQHQILTELHAEVLLVLGSGTQGRSYIVNRDGYFFQSPISWFADNHSWGLSPGFGENAIHFRRTVAVECLFCHLNQVTPVAHTVNRYAQPLPRQLTIGCERCHGPGQLHVQRQEAGKTFEGADETIVNPAHLEPSLREAVCQQCHLLGEERVKRRGRQAFDYRPGLPLLAIFSPFVRPPEIVETQTRLSQVEQMYLSRCFRESTTPNKLGCISCHDPHRLPAPEERAAFYRQRCLACHSVLANGGVVCLGASPSKETYEHHDSPPLTPHPSPKDNCIACHMPRRSGNSLGHAALTDHRVLRWGKTEPPAPTVGESLAPGQMPLRYFYGEQNDPKDAEVLRDLGIALIQKAWTERREEVRRGLCARALTLLDLAVENDPDDIEAMEAQGLGLWACADAPAALATFETVLAKVPERETSREAAAHLATRLRQDDKAVRHWQRFLGTNPWDPSAHYLLAKLLAQQQNWTAAIKEASAALRLQPTHEAARLLLVDGYFHQGQKQRAREEFQFVERLRAAESEKRPSGVREPKP
jgi:hypothetical protein